MLFRSVVLFEDWQQYCREKKIEAVTIDSNKANYSNVCIAYLAIIWQFIRKVGWCDVVMLHGTAKDYLFIAPIVVFISKLRHKKIVLRKFAGNFEQIYNASNKVKLCIYNYIFANSDVQFWEKEKVWRKNNRMNEKGLKKDFIFFLILAFFAFFCTFFDVF